MEVAMLEPWMDKKELAAYFSTSVRSIERAMSKGLPCEEIFGKVKFKVSKVEPWLDEQGFRRRKGGE